MYDDEEEIYVNPETRYFHMAVKRDNVNHVESLLATHVDVNAREDITERTALHNAVLHSQEQIVDVLLQQGAAIDRFDFSGHSVYHLAAEAGSSHIVQALLVERATRSTSQPMGEAAAGSTPIIDMLFRPSHTGDLPLHFCAAYDNSEIAEILVHKMQQHPQQFFTPLLNANGMTPSQLADSRGYAKLSKYLKEAERTLVLPLNLRSKPHVASRGLENPHPAYPKRLAVPDEQVSWSMPWVLYNPLPFTHQTVLDVNNDKRVSPKGWADPEDIFDVKPEQWAEKVSQEGPLIMDSQGYPLNPRGRTGMTERGLLGNWGPNTAADPIITRFDPSGGSTIQLLASLRKDSLGWALPGGMVANIDHNVPAVVHAGLVSISQKLREDELRVFKEQTEQLFASGKVVYIGYVDDPRNTDNAWMETTATHFHCDAKFGARLSFPTQSVGAGVLTWIDIDQQDERYATLFGNHTDWVVSSVLHLREDAGADTGAVLRNGHAITDAEEELLLSIRDKQRMKRNDRWDNRW